jgi:hypothetical protein
LGVYTKEVQPQTWALTNNNLGNAYCNLAPFSANPREQIENAITALRNALLAYTRREPLQARTITSFPA